jgi:cytochrome b
MIEDLAASRGFGEVPVWDRFVRVFHWSLVILIAGAWLSSDDWRALHEWLGYVAAALVAARIAWGFLGPRRARFVDFVRGPAVTLRYLGEVARSRERRMLGHNPLGGAMIVVLILTISTTALTGWLQTTDTFFGSPMLESFHATLAAIILVLVGIHVAGVIHASWHHRENLVRAMVTGHKRAPGPEDVL